MFTELIRIRYKGGSYTWIKFLESKRNNLIMKHKVTHKDINMGGGEQTKYIFEGENMTVRKYFSNF